MSMESEKLEKVVIKKPLSEKEIQKFKKIYIQGILHLGKNYIVEFEYTVRLISIAHDHWSVEGTRKDVEIEDGEIVKNYYEFYNPNYNNTFTSDIKTTIDSLLKEKNGIIIGYKSPEKLKSHYNKAPTKKCKFVNPEAMF